MTTAYFNEYDNYMSLLSCHLPMHLSYYFLLIIRSVELTKESKESGLRNPNMLHDKFVRGALLRRYRGRIAT